MEAGHGARPIGRSRPSGRFRGRHVDIRVALVALLVLAAAIRFAAIGSRLHVDDAYTWLVATAPNPSAFLRRLAATENTPPLIYLLLTPLPIDHPFWLRLPSVISGCLMVPATYWAVTGALGRRVALLAALAVAVAPFLITDSDLARGFMLEDLALLVALGAVIRLRSHPTPRLWALFGLAGVVALYTEYAAAIFLVALTAAAVLTGRPARARMAAAGGLVLATMLPWIPEIVRGQDQVGITKISPPAAAPSPAALRDLVVTLAFGERGGTSSSAGRWLLLLGLVLLAGAGGFVLRRRWPGLRPPARGAIVLLSLTVVLTVAGHALAALFGIDVFSQRYTTILVPLVAVLGAAVIIGLGSRRLTAVCAVLLAGLGIVEIARRGGAQYEPPFAPVRAAAIALHPRTVLTNTPTVLFYLRSLHPVFDRPSNYGPGLAATCARPCLIIDDSRAHGGPPRHVAGATRMIGPYVLTLVTSPPAG